MKLELVTAPTEEPVTLVEAKLHLRVDHVNDDALINGLISAAREVAEKHLRRAIITQSWRLWLDAFPLCDEGIVVPLPKLQSVTALKYTDTTGTLITLANTEYEVDAVRTPGRIVPAYTKFWPFARDKVNAVQVEFTAGYGAATAVPQSVKRGMLFMIGTWYDNRATVVTGTIATEIPKTAELLLQAERVYEYV